jgi:hypothetical protein
MYAIFWLLDETKSEYIDRCRIVDFVGRECI